MLRISSVFPRGQARNPHDLAGVEPQGHALIRSPAPYILKLQHGRLPGGAEDILSLLAVLPERLLGMEQIFPHHIGDELALRQLLRPFSHDLFSVPQHGDAVGNGENLIQQMRYIDDGLSILLEPADDRHQLIHFLFGERGCRLIHDDELGVVGAGLCNGDHLAVGDGQAIHPHLRGNRDSQLVQIGNGLLLRFFQAEKSMVSLFPAHHDIFPDRERRDQCQFLGHHVDAVSPRGVDGIGFSPSPSHQ